MSTLIHDPIVTTPARQPGSMRRTSHIDMIFVDDGLLLRGAARDVRTDDSGRGEVIADAAIDAELVAGHELHSLRVTPATVATDQLVGRKVGRGFRAAAVDALPTEHADSTPLALLLDDLPVAALISGYALLYSGAIDTKRRDAAVSADICAGWRSDGTMMVSVRRGDGVPVPHGPPAEPIERPGDELSWHPIGPLPAGAMRRRRLVEIARGGEAGVWAMFRDSHVDETGAETVLHEYELSARVDPDARSITECVARPTVLPWTECPTAAGSASRLVGVPLGRIRDHVRAELRGVSTCTHLNDLLRSLGDLDALLDGLQSRSD